MPKNIIYVSYWSITIITLIALFTYNFTKPAFLGDTLRRLTMAFIFIMFITKFFAVIILLLDDTSFLMLSSGLASSSSTFCKHQQLAGSPLEHTTSSKEGVFSL